MSREIEYELDDHTMLIGEVSTIDASFDHAFGTEPSKEYQVDNFHVIVWISGIDYDVTKSFSDDDLNAFKDNLILYYKENIEE